MEQFFRKRITVHPLYPWVLRMTDDKAVEQAKMACSLIRVSQF